MHPFLYIKKASSKDGAFFLLKNQSTTNVKIIDASKSLSRLESSRCRRFKTALGGTFAASADLRMGLFFAQNPKR